MAVFLPMAFVQGIAGQLVRDLSLAVSFSIVSSMLVSLTLVPVLQSLGDPEEEGAPEETRTRSVLSLLVIPFALLFRLVAFVVRIGGRLLRLLARPFTAAWDALERTYPWVVGGAVARPGLVLMLALGICVVLVPRAERHGRTLVPELQQREFYVQIELPIGTALSRTDAAVRALGQAIEDDPAVELHYARAGGITQAGSAGGSVTGSHLGQIDVRLRRTDQPSGAVEARLLERMHAIELPGRIELRLGHPTLVAFGPPIEVQVFGEDAMRTAAVARAMLPELREIRGAARGRTRRSRRSPGGARALRSRAPRSPRPRRRRGGARGPARDPGRGRHRAARPGSPARRPRSLAAG